MSAIASGSRNGHNRNENGIVSANLSVPMAMGGPGRPGTRTPEDLFSCGHAACFGSACGDGAKSILHLSPTAIEIKCKVSIGTLPGAGFSLMIDLVARIKGPAAADVELLVDKAHEICPYSSAIRNRYPASVSAAAD